MRYSKAPSRWRRLYVPGVIGLSATLAACQPEQPPVHSQSASQSTETSATQPQSKLPVSLNAVMDALVNESADPIWITAAKPPQNDKEWRAVERAAYQIEVSGALLPLPGTGPDACELASDS